MAFGTRSISGAPDPQNPPMSLFLCYPVLTGIAMDKNTAILASESSNSMGPAIWVAGMHLELQQRCQRVSLSAGIQDAVSLAELSWLAREHNAGMREQRNFQPFSDRSGKKKAVDNNNRTSNVSNVSNVSLPFDLCYTLSKKSKTFSRS